MNATVHHLPLVTVIDRSYRCQGCGGWIAVYDAIPHGSNFWPQRSSVQICDQCQARLEGLAPQFVLVDIKDLLPSIL